MFKTLTIGLVAICLSACASIPPAQVDSKLNAWQGAPIETLIQAWGLPTSEREINGVKYAEWNSKEIKNSPSVNIGVGGFGGNLFGSIGTSLFGGRSESYCKVQVGYDPQGLITHTSWTGESDVCDAAIPARENSTSSQ